MLITLSGPGPLYQQIYRSLRDRILAGELKPGARLPVTRQLAADLSVSRNVVLEAYDELAAEGYATARVGSGTYVSAQVRRTPAAAGRHRTAAPVPSSVMSRYSRRLLECEPSAPAVPGRFAYDFDPGAASGDDFPVSLWRKLMGRRLREPALDYMDPSGHPELREALAAHLKISRRVTCDPGQILIVNGSFQALDLTARVLLDPGDTVVIEDPHYRGARDLFLAAGARLRPIRTDGHGMVTDELPSRVARVKLAYVTPSHQFPSGGILPLGRRLALLEWAARCGVYVVEDDFDNEYVYGERPVEAMQGIDRGETVIYIGTFSRMLFPALRLGYVVAPEPLAPLFRQAKQLADRHSAPLTQQILADFMQGGHLQRHVRRRRARKAELRTALLQSIGEYFGERVQVRGAGAGVHVMVSLPALPAARTERLCAAAASRSVGVYSARPFYLKPPQHCELLMGYGAMTVDTIRAGVRILSEAAAEVGGWACEPACRTAKCRCDSIGGSVAP